MFKSALDFYGLLVVALKGKGKVGFLIQPKISIFLLIVFMFVKFCVYVFFKRKRLVQFNFVDMKCAFINS